jgi:hypothetical protein
MFDPIKVRRTLHLVPHFHVDPVWWNTQAASIDQLHRSDWSGSPRMGFQRSALDVFRQHLEHAERDADYRFCVAEVDYLEPFWFHHPHERHRVERLLQEGRLDVVGATYNEPSTNLTSLELTRRNLQLGLAFQRDVLGARADISWQLDVFGHDPSLPSVLADAGVTTTVFARGPYGPWGPLLDGGFDALRPTDRRPIASEFEWIAPDGSSVLAVYLVGHYSSGYELDRRETLDEAMQFVTTLDEVLGPLASTDQVFVPIGTDLGPPSRWVTDLARDEHAIAGHPSISVSTPTAAIDAICRAAQSAGRPFAPISRDMGPVYTGKDVSYIDSKQAHRAVEQVLLEAEAWAAIAHARGVTSAPPEAIDDAWRLLIYGAHHDALTGTESDQVYIDLTANWRHAHDLATTQRIRATSALAAATDTQAPGDDRALALVVHSATFGRRRDVIHVTLGHAELDVLRATGLRVTDRTGADVAFVVDDHECDDDGHLVGASLTVLVEVEDIGRHVLHVRPGSELPRWEPIQGHRISNGVQSLTVDAQRGGCVTSWIGGDGVETVHAGELANELVWYREYPSHPDRGEGPWHLSPTGERAASGATPARVRATRSPLGERLLVHGSIEHDGAIEVRYVNELTLWNGLDRLDTTIQTDDVDGCDHLIRVRWPVGATGTTPVFETAEATVGRSPAFVDVDAAEHPWTLDTPTHGWFGTSVTCRIDVRHREEVMPVAVAVAEIVVEQHDALAVVRPLVVALAASGVTATVTLREADRAGLLGVDSSVPDVRIVVGAVDDPVVLDQLGRLSGDDHRRLQTSLDARSWARAWIPAARPRREVLQPGLDVRGSGDLCTLLVVGADRDRLEPALVALVEELGRSAVAVDSADSAPTWARSEMPDDRTVALFNRGTPGSAVDASGGLIVSLQRASTGWPSGVWIDPPRRTVPDGSAFQLQHWTHRFDLALVARAGDWRAASIGRAAQHYRHPLHVHVEPCHPGELAAGVADLRSSSDAVELRSLTITKRPTGAAGLTLRVSEDRGRPTTTAIAAPVPVRSARRVDLRGRAVDDETVRCDDGEVSVGLGPFQATTLDVRSDVLDHLPDASASVAADERPRPAFSRWWVQGRGPRTSTVGPLAVQIHPAGNAPGARWAVTVARVPGCLAPLDDDAALTVSMHLEGDGLTLSGPEDVELVPGGYTVVALDGQVRASTGHHVVRISAAWQSRSGRAGISYDEVVVSAATCTPAIEFRGPGPVVELAAGSTAEATWTLVNHTDRELYAEIDIVSPWGTWDLIPTARTATVLPAGAATDLVTDVRAAVGQPSGTWWWLARAVAGPNVAYSPAATLAVLPAPAVDDDPPV